MGKTYQLVQAGFEQTAVSTGRHRLAAGLLQRVKAGHHAAPGIQCGHRVHTAHEADVQVQAMANSLLAQG